MTAKPLLIPLLIPLLVTTLSFASFCYGQSDEAKNTPSQLDVIMGKVSQYCGACHKVPPADVMPKKFWPRAVKAMADLAAKQMGAEFIPEHAIRDITAYYYGTSPEALPTLPYYQTKDNALRFITTSLAEKSILPLIVNVKAVQLGADDKTEFLIADAARNQVLLLSQKGNTWQETVLADVKVPSHSEVIDYDQDGDQDIIIAALGLMPPSDELAGKVLLLRQSEDGQFSEEVIIQGIGRVTDARPVDLDNDGDLDLAVAVFGGGKVGEIAWLENKGQGKHIKHDIIGASGALNVSLADLNNDGKMDIVSLIAQEYEMVLALINKGAGQFQQVSLAEAPHPMFGSTGMRLVDLDGDKDIDVLFTNGDAHDLQMDPKPYHGVQWLENKGALKFQFHDIGRFYGAASAVPGDLDGDGDLDVVAGSWNNDWQDSQRQSLIWFENDGKQNFSRHNIINSPHSIVSFELTDVTQDGRLDIVAGSFRMDLLIAQMKAQKTSAESLKARVVLLENQGLTNTNTTANSKTITDTKTKHKK